MSVRAAPERCVHYHDLVLDHVVNELPWDPGADERAEELRELVHLLGRPFLASRHFIREHGGEFAAFRPLPGDASLHLFVVASVFDEDVGDLVLRPEAGHDCKQSRGCGAVGVGGGCEAKSGRRRAGGEERDLAVGCVSAGRYATRSVGRSHEVGTIADRLPVWDVSVVRDMSR